jgi:hypothetical protein
MLLLHELEPAASQANIKQRNNTTHTMEMLAELLIIQANL